MSSDQPTSWPFVPGEMAGRIRDHRWAPTALGPVDHWPPCLRTAVELMLDAPQIASLVVGPDRLFLYNDRAASHYGDKHPGALGRPLAATFPEAATVAGFYDRAFAGEGLHIPAQPLDTAGTGSVEIYDAYLTPVRDPTNGVVAVLMTGVAIGARLAAEAALGERERRLRNVLDSMNEAFALLGPDYTIRAVNAETQRLDGRPPEALVGRTHWDAFPGSEALPIGALLRRVMATRQAETIEHRYRWPHGRTMWLEARCYPAEDGGVAIFWRDISEQRAAADALRDSEARLTAFFESLPVGAGIIDLGGRMVQANLSMRRFLPSSKIPSSDPDRGWRWRAVDTNGAPIAPEDFPGARARRGIATLPGLEMIYTDEDGREIWTSVSAAPIRDAEGAVVGHATVIHDIDALKRAGETQQLLIEELQHRVRNILAIIRSIVRRSYDEDRSAEEFAQHLEGRLAALARTQVLLTRQAGVGIELEDMLREELLVQVAQEEQFTLDGPEVTIAPKAAEVLTLAIHELATNSTKYGAFSRPRGRLAVWWRREERDGETWLALDWIESGVPNGYAAPYRAGFGTELIERRVPYDLKGSGSLKIERDGLTCRIAFPLLPGESILQTKGAAR